MFSTVVFDGIIALVLGSIPIFLLARYRRKKVFGVSGAFLLLGWVVVFYGSFIEPKQLQTRTYETAIGVGKGRQLSIAVVSDLHLGIYKHRDWTEKVVKAINALRPDLVVLAGDNASNVAGLEAFEPLKDIQSRFGTYAVLGNWDYSTGAVDVRKRIESYNVEVLTNESVAIPVPGADIRLIGLDDYRDGKPDWSTAMAQVPPSSLKIVVVHNPDFAPQAEIRNVDLLIAGHTHCGQIRLPVLGPVPKMPISIGRRFDCGVFNFGPTRLFITPGVGESGTRARLFDQPEVSLLKVTY